MLQVRGHVQEACWYHRWLRSGDRTSETLGIDSGVIRMVITHAAGMHGLGISSASVDLACGAPARCSSGTETSFVRNRRSLARSAPNQPLSFGGAYGGDMDAVQRPDLRRLRLKQGHVTICAAGQCQNDHQKTPPARTPKCQQRGP